MESIDVQFQVVLIEKRPVAKATAKGFEMTP
jgi:hypothetical protein